MKGGADVPLDIYRSRSPGFVIQHNANADVLSLRVCAAPPRRCTYQSVLRNPNQPLQPYRSSSSVSRQSGRSTAHADGSCSCGCPTQQATRSALRTTSLLRPILRLGSAAGRSDGVPWYAMRRGTPAR